MAAERTLKAFGFDCSLDWRPTVFVDGMPSNRVCSACGLVPSTVAMLSCRHVLCQPCYDRCIANDSRCCLDGDAIDCDDVVWTTFSAESLLRRKIRCWNAPAGCSASGPAHEILDHFSNKCEHHTVMCSRCERSVAHKDVVDHISSGSCIEAAIDERPTRGNADSEVKPIMSALGKVDEKLSRLQTSLEENWKHITDSMQNAAETPCPDFHLLESNQCLENTIRESTQLNRQALVEIGEAHAKLQNDLALINSSLQGIGDLVSDIRASERRISKGKEGAAMEAYADVKRDVDALTVASAAERQKNEQNTALLEKIVDEIRTSAANEQLFKRFYEEVHAKLAVIESVSNSPFNKKLNAAEPLQWSIESVSELKKELPPRNTFARSPEYFYGYHILPGVSLQTKDDVHSFQLVFQICRGVYDQILTWPIKKKLYLRFLHPTQSDKNESVCVDTAVKYFDAFRMPTEEKTAPLVSTQSVKLGKLEEDSYIKDDKILVRFEVMP